MATVSMQQLGRPASYIALFHNRGYVLLWTSSVISALGTAVTYLALPLFVLQLTGSPVALGLAFVWETVPWVLLGPLTGLFVDRWDRKALIVWTSMAQGVVIGMAPFVSAAWVLYVLTFVSSALFVISAPARTAVAPEVVGHALLGRAVAFNQATQQVVQIAGPMFAAAVVAAVTPRFGFLIDAASFMFAGVMISGVSIPHATTSPGSPSTYARAAFAEPVAFLRRKGTLAYALALSAPGMVVMGAVLALTPAIVVSEFRLGAWGVGVLSSAFGAGVVVGAAFAAARAERIAPIVGMAAGLLLFAAAFGPVPYAKSLVAASVLWVVAGVGRGLGSTIAQVRFAVDTPVDLRGRVFALVNAATMLARMAGSAVAGLVAASTGAATALAVIAGGSVAVAVIFVGLMWCGSLRPRRANIEEA